MLLLILCIHDMISICHQVHRWHASIITSLFFSVHVFQPQKCDTLFFSYLSGLYVSIQTACCRTLALPLLCLYEYLYHFCRQPLYMLIFTNALLDANTYFSWKTSKKKKAQWRCAHSVSYINRVVKSSSTMTSWVWSLDTNFVKTPSELLDLLHYFPVGQYLNFFVVESVATWEIGMHGRMWRHWESLQQ